MKDIASDETVIDTLRAALDTNKLPAAAQEYAEHLLKRLGSPVRVSVLGLPDSGKSQLINMLIGQRLLPGDMRLPTTELRYGDSEHMHVTFADGADLVSEKIDLNVVADKRAAFLKIEMPVPLLKRISLLEVVTDGTDSELSSALKWAVGRTDIALWCSQSFEGTEQAVWQNVPDALKDHAFLVLTKADILSAEHVLSKRVAALESVVAEEFHSLFAVATLQAIKAHRGDGAVDEQLYHASGGGALTSEILRHAERGRRADFDGAHMFLARYKIPLKKPELKVVETSNEDAAGAVDPAEDLQVAAPVSEEASAAPAAETEATPSPAPDVPKGAQRPENIALFSDAVRFLKRRGESLSDAADTAGEGKTKPLVDQCVNAVEYLTDLFSQDESGCPVADEFLDELAEAGDMMILMQIESGDGASADAATLLLQLRRDMEMRLAA